MRRRGEPDHVQQSVHTDPALDAHAAAARKAALGVGGRVDDDDDDDDDAISEDAGDATAVDGDATAADDLHWVLAGEKCVKCVKYVKCVCALGGGIETGDRVVVEIVVVVG